MSVNNKLINESNITTNKLAPVLNELNNIIVKYSTEYFYKLCEINQYENRFETVLSKEEWQDSDTLYSYVKNGKQISKKKPITINKSCSKAFLYILLDLYFDYLNYPSDNNLPSNIPNNHNTFTIAVFKSYEIYGSSLLDIHITADSFTVIRNHLIDDTSDESDNEDTEKLIYQIDNLLSRFAAFLTYFTKYIAMQTLEKNIQCNITQVIKFLHIINITELLNDGNELLVNNELLAGIRTFSNKKKDK